MDNKKLEQENKEEREERVTSPTDVELSYVYVLGSNGAGGPKSYVGWTLDLDRRLLEHNSGAGARTTRGRSWQLLYAERYETREEAQSREWFLKKDRRFRRRVLKSIG